MKATIVVVFLACLSVCSAIVDYKFCYRYSGDCAGNDIGGWSGVTQGQCERACLYNPKCKSLQYYNNSHTCMDKIMERVVGGTACGVSFGDVRITDLDFADDAVIFGETKGALVGALERLSEEAAPLQHLGLRVAWLKTKAKVFGDLLEAAVDSIPLCGESVDVVEGFTYIGSVVHRSAR